MIILTHIERKENFPFLYIFIQFRTSTNWAMPSTLVELSSIPSILIHPDFQKHPPLTNTSLYPNNGFYLLPGYNIELTITIG